MRILLLGNSAKFEIIVSKLWPESILEKMPWRCMNANLTMNKFDKIVVCGYDYESSKYNFEDFIHVNVTSATNFLSLVCTEKTHLIYINTFPGKKKFTFSRYLYAKQLLAFELIKLFKNTYLINTPTILVDNGKTNSSFTINPVIVNVLSKFKIIKVICFDELLRVIKNYKITSTKKVFVPRPIFLKFSRSIFLDRLMRILIG
jgi:hypothetical protein